ncbi:MAG: hypothetical protein AB2556_25880 [Candidatus Thiodiazotropha sp.]
MLIVLWLSMWHVALSARKKEVHIGSPLLRNIGPQQRNTVEDQVDSLFIVVVPSAVLEEQGHRQQR